MAVRLGEILYWLGCLAAACFLAIGIWIITATGDNRIGFMAFVLIPVPITWVVGRACRYLLAGT